MMWGHWHVFAGDAPFETDKPERTRIVVPEAVAVLFSAPVFEVGEGDPMQEVEFLRQPVLDDAQARTRTEPGLTYNWEPVCCCRR